MACLFGANNPCPRYPAAGLPRVAEQLRRGGEGRGEVGLGTLVVALTDLRSTISIPDSSVSFGGDPIADSAGFGSTRSSPRQAGPSVADCSKAPDAPESAQADFPLLQAEEFIPTAGNSFRLSRFAITPRFAIVTRIPDKCSAPSLSPGSMPGPTGFPRPPTRSKDSGRRAEGCRGRGFLESCPDNDWFFNPPEAAVL